MTSIFPPILENRAPAIDYVGSAEEAKSKTLDIHFMMPTLNSVGKNGDIKNAQVVVRYKSNNQIAISPSFLPDRATLFYNIEEESKYWSIDSVTGLCTLKVPYSCFIGGQPAYNTEYYVQVRFGDSPLWGQTVPGLQYNDLREFSSWHSIQVNAIPSHFGEWSNISTVYCTRRAATDLSYNLDDYVPELVWEYRPSSGALDTIEQIQVQWEWDQDDRVMDTKHYVQSQVYTGARNESGAYTFRVKIPIAPVTTIYFFVNAVTSHNVIYNDSTVLVCNPLNLPIRQGVDCYIETKKLEREENNDGIIAKEFYFNSENSEAVTINLYRYNLNTLECVKLEEGLTARMFTHYIVKDYTVEMGEEYQYVACFVNQYNKVFKVFEKMTTAGEGTGGYARLMFMEASFLTTRHHQLRLHGGVSISAFKRNVSEQFQTTIGSKFPFYSRNGAQNYRTFTLQATISINFDPTFAFVRLRDGIGATWEDGETSKFIFGEKDLYGEDQFSLSRVRSGYDKTSSFNFDLPNIENLLETKPRYAKQHDLTESERDHHPEIKQLQYDYEGDAFGPKTIYSPFLAKRTTTNVGTSQSNENIFLERKFRELVMSWLSDGKPKLYRSETEGNMIVMLSGVSFTPVQKTQRLIYSMSCTVTEIAEYNLENLILYDLIPSEIVSNYNPVGEWDFEAGDYDPMLDHKMKFNILNKFRIPDTQVGSAITEIDLSLGVVNGTPPFYFTGGSGVGQYLIPGVRLLKTGEIFGTPTEPSDSQEVLITVRDSDPNGATEIQFPFKIGKIYPRIQIKDTTEGGQPIKIDGLTVGVQITPINVGLDPKAPGQPPYTWYVKGLPPGLMMKMAGQDNHEVIISGAFAYEVSEGTFTLIVEDAYGQVDTATIAYGSSLTELRYLYDSNWDTLPEMEEGAANAVPFEFGKTVIGGVGSYHFSMDPIPKGMQFDVNTGTLTGVPNGDKYPVHSTKTVLTVTDDEGRTDSVEMIMPTIYARFVFDDNVELSNFFKSETGWFGVGTLFNDLSIMSLKNGDNPIVRGGKQHTENNFPPYIFDCIADTGGILDNFGVDNRGVVHGYTVSSHPAGTIAIRATDARGVQIARKFSVDETRGNFYISRQPEWKIDEMPQSKTMPADGWLVIYPKPPGFMDAGGPWEDWVVTYSDFPPGMRVEKAIVNGASIIRVVGALSGTYAKKAGVINVTDGYGQQASVTIPIGDVYSTVQWRDDIITIESRLENTPLGAARNLPQIYSGTPPYSIFVEEGSLTPYVLDKMENLTGSDTVHLIDGGDGAGAPNADRRTVVLRAKDSRGTISPQAVTVVIEPVFKKFSTKASIVPATYFIKGISTFSDGDFQIATITGGSGDFTFKYNGQVGKILPNGLTLTAKGYLTGTTSIVTPETILTGLSVVDNVSGETIPIDNFIMPTTIPEPTVHPSIIAAYNGDQEYVINNMVVKTAFKSQFPLFSIPIGGAVISSNNVPEKLAVDREYYLTGEPQLSTNLPIHATVTATLPGNTFTPPYPVTVKLLIDKISGLLSFRWVPTNAGTQGAIAVNKKFELKISDGASGGRLPYTWKILSGADGTGLTLKTNADGSEAILQGTPTAKRDIPFTVKIELTDADGTKAPVIEVSFNGIYDELKFNSSGVSIPAKNGDEDIDLINITDKISGGKPPYIIISPDLGKWGYRISEGVISGTANHSSVDAGKAILEISDSVGQKITPEIPVGKITGVLGLKQTSYTFPKKTKGTSVTLDLSQFVIIGTSGGASYDLPEEIPTGWAKEGSYGLELSETGRISGRYPNTTINTEMSFTVRITGDDATVQIFTIYLPKVT